MLNDEAFVDTKAGIANYGDKFNAFRAAVSTVFPTEKRIKAKETEATWAFGRNGRLEAVILRLVEAHNHLVDAAAGKAGKEDELDTLAVDPSSPVPSAAVMASIDVARDLLPMAIAYGQLNLDAVAKPDATGEVPITLDTVSYKELSYDFKEIERRLVDRFVAGKPRLEVSFEPTTVDSADGTGVGSSNGIDTSEGAASFATCARRDVQNAVTKSHGKLADIAASLDLLGMVDRFASSAAAARADSDDAADADDADDDDDDKAGKSVNAAEMGVREFLRVEMNFETDKLPPRLLELLKSPGVDGALKTKDVRALMASLRVRRSLVLAQQKEQAAGGGDTAARKAARKVFMRKDNFYDKTLSEQQKRELKASLSGDDTAQLRWTCGVFGLLVKWADFENAWTLGDAGGDSGGEDEDQNFRLLFQPNIDWPLSTYLEFLGYSDFPDMTITVAEAVDTFFYLSTFLTLGEK